MEYLPGGCERRREFSREIQNVHILLCIKMYIICIAGGGWWEATENITF